jgi:8-oxo-dGTP pyrophosphatase MutT (NUDIX family)
MKMKKKRKVSFGIVLSRFNGHKKQHEVLVVKKRVSHAFSYIVFNVHRKDMDRTKIQDYVKQTTRQEKVILLSMDYDRMWYHIWLCIPTRYNDIDKLFNFYNTSKKGFMSNVSNNDMWFRDTIYQANNSHTELSWEFPKGRIMMGEKPIECSMREFKEETNVESSEYVIFHTIKPMTITHQENNVTYTSVYYFAHSIDGKANPRIDFRNSRQIDEVIDICWVKLGDLKTIHSYNNELQTNQKLIKAKVKHIKTQVV